jgi:hypothetical protein
MLALFLMLSLTLTQRQQEAFDYLMHALRVQEPRVGEGGTRSAGFLAMRVLSKSAIADAAFKELVAHGTPAGQLYGLIGVRRTDPAFFRTSTQRVVRSGSVDVVAGCLTWSESIARFISDPTAIQLPAGTSLNAWLVAHPKNSQPLDIAGGGYSSLFLDTERDDKTALRDEEIVDFKTGRLPQR